MDLFMPIGLVSVIIASEIGLALSHGRLVEPPSRSSMWRYGFDSPPNYNDNELYCGGFTRQWIRNGGKCGICGDPWDSPTPRLNEAGGKYANGIIVRKYLEATDIDIHIELTANHKGHFEFRLCPNNNPKRTARQSCLDKYLLNQADGEGPFYEPGPGNKIFETKYSLPRGLVCSQCVLQWRYVAGNNWGTCPNGTSAVGCGPQEEFRACADVAVLDPTGRYNVTEADVDENEVDDSDLNEYEVFHPEDHAVDDSDGARILILFVISLLFALLIIGTLIAYYYVDRTRFAKFFESKHCANKVQNWRRLVTLNCNWRKVADDHTPKPPPRAKRAEGKGLSPLSCAKYGSSTQMRQASPKSMAAMPIKGEEQPAVKRSKLDISGPLSLSINGGEAIPLGK